MHDLLVFTIIHYYSPCKTNTLQLWQHPPAKAAPSSKSSTHQQKPAPSSQTNTPQQKQHPPAKTAPSSKSSTFRKVDFFRRKGFFSGKRRTTERDFFKEKEGFFSGPTLVGQGLRCPSNQELQGGCPAEGRGTS